MSNEEAPDDFADRVKRKILDTYGFESEAELDAATEEAFPGLLDAEAEYEARHEAYLAALPGRMESAVAKVTAHLQAQGVLPDGVKFAFVAEEPIVVDYATDRPPWRPAPGAPEPTEDQKQAAVEAANARIEQWQQQWESGVLNYDLPPVPRPPYPPLSDRVARRDGPRSRDYPAGG